MFLYFYYMSVYKERMDGVLWYVFKLHIHCIFWNLPTEYNPLYDYWQSLFTLSFVDELVISSLLG